MKRPHLITKYYRRSTMSDHWFPSFTIFSFLPVTSLCIWCVKSGFMIQTHNNRIYSLLKIQLNRFINISIIIRTKTWKIKTKINLSIIVVDKIYILYLIKVKTIKCRTNYKSIKKCIKKTKIKRYLNWAIVYIYNKDKRNLINKNYNFFKICR